MNETSLAEVVRQLDRTTGTSASDSGTEAVPPSGSRAGAILDGLRSTDLLLAELRERYRELRVHRDRLASRLRELEGDASGPNPEVAGALAIQ
jgi:hypothetical protein